MSITKRYFGTLASGAQIDLFILKNSKGVSVDIINFGGIVVSLKVPDEKGIFEDIVLGYDKLSDYERNSVFFGGTIGRYANRIGNANFKLNGEVYKLDKNDGENHLHGGFIGFHKVVWRPEVICNDGIEALRLNYKSHDVEGGYPGNLDVKVTFTLNEQNEFRIDYYAVSDKDTIVNLTNHSYFNLSGHASGSILEHKLKINADEFTPTDSASIPTGEISIVSATPMDFTSFKSIGRDIESNYEQLIFAKGYDHNFVLNTEGDISKKAAELIDEETGRVMEVFTTKPGVQLYTGNFLDGSEVGKGGTPYYKNAALCLETQHFPDSINKCNFPSPLLEAGKSYEHSTIYKFSTI